MISLISSFVGSYIAIALYHRIKNKTSISYPYRVDWKKVLQPWKYS